MDDFKPLPPVMNEFFLYELKRHLPYSIKAYNMIACANEGIFPERKVFFRPKDGYMDTSAFIIKNIYVGPVQNNYENSYAVIASECGVLENVLRSCSLLDWNTPMLFNTVPHDQMWTYQTVAMDKGGCLYLAPKPLWHYKLEDESKLNIITPVGVEVINLNESHAQTVYDSWKLKFLMDLNHVQTMLSREKGVGIVVKETQELVTWFILNAYGSLGLLYTKEQHRGKGYAAVCIAAFCKKLLDEDNLLIGVDIEDHNEKSKKLFQCLGFVKNFPYYLGRYIPNSMQDKPEFAETVAGGTTL